MDITDLRQSATLMADRPDVIIHTAAFTAVDGAEREPHKR